MTLQAIIGHAKRHPEEIAQKRQAWLAKLRDEPLANPRDRVRELAKMYGVSVLSLYREMCPACGGQGTLPVLRMPMDTLGHVMKGAVPILKRTRCETCRGRKWVLPEEGQAMHEATGGDVRFDTVPTLPPVIDPELLEVCRDILRQIREEVGDAWSPREQTATPDSTFVGRDVNAVQCLLNTQGRDQDYMTRPELTGPHAQSGPSTQNHNMVVLSGNKEEYIARLRQIRDEAQKQRETRPPDATPAPVPEFPHRGS